MKMNLNKEMLEKIKKLKGKMVLVPATFALVAGITLTGCNSADAIEPTTPVTSEVVSEEVVSENEVSENEVSEEVVEEPTEEISEEIVEEEVVDYSVSAIDGLVNEITTTYPNEDPRQIAAVVINTNAKYMTEEEIDAVLTAYELTKEEVTQMFLEYFTNRGEIMYMINCNLEGATFENVPEYETLVPIYMYCLNPAEYQECLALENEFAECRENDVSMETGELGFAIGNDYDTPSLAKMLAICTVIEYVEPNLYDSCLPFSAEIEKTMN